MKNEKLSNYNMLHNNIPLETPYHFQLLDKKHIKQVVDIFTHAFCHSEPMTRYLKMDEKKYKIFAHSVTEKAYEDGLSIIGLDGEKVIACALIEDIAAPGPIPDFDPKFVYILALLESLGANFFADKTFSPKQIAHLFITAVHEDYRGLGLSKQVNFRSLDVAAGHGFNTAYCELTNVYNEIGIMHHLRNPKRLIGSCLYHEFIYEGIKPFKNLAGLANSYLWAIKPDAKLIYSQNNMTICEDLEYYNDDTNLA